MISLPNTGKEAVVRYKDGDLANRTLRFLCALRSYRHAYPA